MKLEKEVVGLAYQLRSVTVEDAEFIIELRNSSSSRSEFLSKISNNVVNQQHWIDNQIKRDDDLYFIIENRFSGARVGTIGIYNIKDQKAEWGRWLIQNNLGATIESYLILCRLAFEELKLNSISSKTHKENAAVIAFHDSIETNKQRALLPSLVEEDKLVEGFEHTIVKDDFIRRISPMLLSKVIALNSRVVRETLGGLEFQHVGI